MYYTLTYLVYVRSADSEYVVAVLFVLLPRLSGEVFVDWKVVQKCLHQLKKSFKIMYEFLCFAGWLWAKKTQSGFEQESANSWGSKQYQNLPFISKCEQHEIFQFCLFWYFAYLCIYQSKPIKKGFLCVWIYKRIPKYLTFHWPFETLLLDVNDFAPRVP